MATPIATAGDYQLSLDVSSETPTIHVRATIPATHQLHMAMYGGIDHLPDQWTSFVRDLSITDTQGNAISYHHSGPRGWTLEPEGARELSLSYRVDLSFAAQPWPPGNEQAGWIGDEVMYLVTRPLFIYNEDDLAHQVSITLPSGWQATTPWIHHGDSNFSVSGNDSLTENTIVLGEHVTHTFREGPIALTVVALGELGDGARLVPRVLGSVARQAMKVFSEAQPRRIMMTFFPAHQDDGESFNDSAAFTVGKPMSAGGLPLWGNNLAHEFFHHWVGGEVALSVDDSGEWFEEGFTDYLADRSLARARLISTREFLNKAEKVIGRYLYFHSGALFEAMSMSVASKNKGRNRFAVYDGGWALAFCLDIKLRNNNDHGLDALLRQLHAKSRQTEQPLEMSDFEEAINQVSGQGMVGFVRSATNEPGPLPIRECLMEAGLELEIQAYAAETWISKVAESTTFDAIVGAPPCPELHGAMNCTVR
jgi:predicted metalloprotease with PDZ domain